MVDELEQKGLKFVGKDETRDENGNLRIGQASVLRGVPVSPRV